MTVSQSKTDHAREFTELQHRIEVAAGRRPADLLLTNLKIIDVGAARIFDGSLAIVEGRIAGFEAVSAKETVDCGGLYALPGLIDGHIHIESSMVTPEEISRLLVP